MIRVFEFSAFVVVALGLHLAAGFLDQTPGGDSGGDTGLAYVTLQGAPADIDQIIATWTKPPDHTVPDQTLQPPSAPADTPVPTLQIEPRPVSRAQVALAAPDYATPQMRTEPAPPAPPVKTKSAQKPAKPAAPTQRAAGSGKNGQAGTKGQTKALGKGQENKLIAQWGSKIRSRIERKKRAPRTANSGGRVHLRIKVAPSGHLQSAQITKSSGVAAYDKAALNAVKRSGRFAKAPKGLTKSSYSFRFSITFKR